MSASYHTGKPVETTFSGLMPTPGLSTLHCLAIAKASIQRRTLTRLFAAVGASARLSRIFKMCCGWIARTD